jgi:ABC-type amino acid transport system permease subunit
MERGGRLYVELFQGMPLLMQLFLAYFGLALLGLNVSAWVAAALALTLYTSAYLAEIWRGCVEAIPKGQWEGSASLAMSFSEQLRHVIGPQAVRIAVPPTVGFLVQVVKRGGAQVGADALGHQRQQIGARPVQRPAQQRRAQQAAADEGSERQRHRPARGQQQVAQDVPEAEIDHGV